VLVHHQIPPVGPAVARLDHLHRPQEDRHHVHDLGLIMLLRGFADA
jgi:hypothetical protein